MNIFRFLNNYNINKDDLIWIFEQITKQNKTDLKQLRLTGVYDGWKIDADGTWNLSITNGYGHDENGETLETTKNKILNCEFDYEGITVIPAKGNNRYISIFAVWSEKDGEETGILKDLTTFKKHILDNISFICVRGEEFPSTIPITPNEELPATMPIYAGTGIRLVTFVIRNGTLEPVPTGILSGWKMHRATTQDGLIDFLGDKIDLIKSTLPKGIINIAALLDSLASSINKEMTLGELTSGISSYKIMDLRVTGIDVWSLWYLDRSLASSPTSDFKGGLAVLKNIRVIHRNTPTDNDVFNLFDNASVGKAFIYSFEGSLGVYTKAPTGSDFKYDDFESYNILQDSVIDQDLMTPSDSVEVGLLKGSGQYVSNSGTFIKKERIYGTLSSFKPTGPVNLCYVFMPYTIRRDNLPAMTDITIVTEGQAGLGTAPPDPVFIHTIRNDGVILGIRSQSGMSTQGIMMWRGYLDIG